MAAIGSWCNGNIMVSKTIDNCPIQLEPAKFNFNIMGEIRIVYDTNIGHLIEKANEEGVNKDNYIDIVKQGEAYILLYYYGREN